jgi:transcriptional regulator with XRE-family HTH domain
MQKSVFSTSYNQLLRKLVEARKAAGLTQTQVALMLKRPQSFVSKVENGERRIDVIELLEIARVYKISAPMLIADLEAPEYSRGKGK